MNTEENIVTIDKENMAEDTDNNILSNMSHEIRTPLHAILGFSTLALNCSDAEEIKSYLKTINESAIALTNSLDLMKEHLYSDLEGLKLFTFIAKKAAKEHLVKDEPCKKIASNDKALSKIKVLSVDDTALNLTLISKFLSKEDMLVTSVSSSLKALELIEYKEFDIIILDYMMTELNGLECVKILREKGVTTPVIMLTADVGECIKEEFMLYGNAFLSKPIDFKKLISLIYELVFN